MPKKNPAIVALESEREAIHAELHAATLAVENLQKQMDGLDSIIATVRKALDKRRDARKAKKPATPAPLLVS